jgi:hypothetical protein
VTTTATATAPVDVVTAEDGKRYYLIDGARFWSVSTATSVIASEGLPPWAAGLAAKTAFDELPTVVAASRIRQCGRTYARCGHDFREPHTDTCRCFECKACVIRWLTDRHRAESSRRADEGRRTHDVIEWWALHDGQWITYSDDIAPYVAAFRAFIADYGITPASFLITECVVIDRANECAGTTDGIVRFEAKATPAAAELVARVITAARGEAGPPITAAEAAGLELAVDLVIDFKTQEKPREKEKFYPNQALQLAGYRWSPVMRIKGTDIEQPMPDTHGAALIHLRPDGATVRLTRAGEDVHEAFLHALCLWRWLSENGTASVSSRSFPLPKPVKVASPRKTAVKKAAPVAPPTAAPAPAGRPAATAPARPAMRPLAERLAGRMPGALLTDDDIPF